MSTVQERSEIAVLQTQMSTVQKDVNDIKSDIKEIKATLASNLVTQAQFRDFRKAVRVNYIFILVITSIITAMAYALIVGRVK